MLYIFSNETFSSKLNNNLNFLKYFNKNFLQKSQKFKFLVKNSSFKFSKSKEQFCLISNKSSRFFSKSKISPKSFEKLFFLIINLTNYFKSKLKKKEIFNF